MAPQGTELCCAMYDWKSHVTEAEGQLGERQAWGG